MTRSFDGSYRRRRSALVAALLVSTILSGGIARADTGTAPATGPLQLAPVVTQTGFSELATKVRPAVVNIATSELSRQVSQQIPELAPNSQMPDMFRHQHTGPEHALGSGFIVDSAESGIQSGDIIVRVGDTAVATPNEAIAKIHEAQKSKKEAIPLLVTRNGTTYYVALQLAQG